jgi:hypothetical protein
MSNLFANPTGLLVVACLCGLVIGLNLTLLGLLTGNKTVHEEASKWGKALRGDREARQRQEAQVEELHRLVTKLEAEHTGHSEADQGGGRIHGV